MKAIGGYFELELNCGKEYYDDLLRLNTGRNALEYLLLANKYSKIYLPYFTCSVLHQPIKKHNILVEFYLIDRNLEPIFDFSLVKKQEVFLYTNYFGLKDNYISVLAARCKNLVIDNAQAFYSKPLKGIDTFYSPRKFFGVPDGGYLFTNKTLTSPLARDHSWQRFEHLLQRTDVSPEDGYTNYKKNESSLDNLPIMDMSLLSQNILKSIDYKYIALKRRNNFKYLSQHLDGINKINFDLNEQAVPLVYPFLCDDADLREKLQAQKIYTSQYWAEVKNIADINSVEYLYTNNLVHLPVDQRYQEAHLDKIIQALT